MANTILLITVIFAGLMAGLFFAFSFAVMPGLGKLSDKGFISTMQSINITIQNPVFFLVFMGILILLPVSSGIAYKYSLAISFRYILAGSVIYFLGVFAVTAVGNIPLNNALASLNTESASQGQLSEARAAFENKWNTLNSVRTISSIASFILLLIGYNKI